MGGETASLRWLAVMSGVAPLAEPAFAGAWTQKAGEQQWITTVSRETGDFGETWRTDNYGEAGFGGGWGVNLSIDSEIHASDEFDDRVGLRAGVQKSFALTDRASFSVTASMLGGESVDGPDCQGSGYEARAAIGTSFAIAGREGFINLEGAAKSRESCDRQLIELATGIEVVRNLDFVVKGWVEDGAFVHSEKIEPSLLYSFEKSKIGIGWRREVSGAFKEEGWLVTYREMY
jgi:hypothetical protein